MYNVQNSHILFQVKHQLKKLLSLPISIILTVFDKFKFLNNP